MIQWYKLSDEQVFVKSTEGVLRIPDMDLNHPDISLGVKCNLV